MGRRLGRAQTGPDAAHVSGTAQGLLNVTHAAVQRRLSEPVAMETMRCTDDSFHFYQHLDPAAASGSVLFLTACSESSSPFHRSAAEKLHSAAAIRPPRCAVPLEHLSHLMLQIQDGHLRPSPREPLLGNTLPALLRCTASGRWRLPTDLGSSWCSAPTGEEGTRTFNLLTAESKLELVAMAVKTPLRDCNEPLTSPVTHRPLCLSTVMAARGLMTRPLMSSSLWLQSAV
ncbi:hypothetical protein CCH79_00003943 [Gambusia affinis]|uniref:Uncharacterized protein n=1 Tax=Gambusia affinis TaxID=33528 RepID=A0A315V3N5_GAMAF|nr:hypothetical protein CCH79_00003943 [Gambusia affinis]